MSKITDIAAHGRYFSQVGINGYADPRTDPYNQL